MRRNATTVLIVFLLLSSALWAQLQYKPVDQSTVTRRLNTFAGENFERALSLHQMFANAGCDGKNLIDQAVPETRDPNVICVLPGKTAQTIIVGAHYDHVPNSLGVVDNWSGAALLPSLYAALNDTPREHTYIFVGFAGGEQEDLGSQFYARSLTKQQRSLVTGMINIESVGLTPAKAWVKKGDKNLANALFKVSDEVKIPVTNVDMPENTDSESFRQNKMPVLTIHSLTQEAWNAKAIHGAQDQLTAMNLGLYYETYRLVSAFLAYLDAPPAAPAQSAK